MAKSKISSPSARKELETLAKEILTGFKDLEEEVKTFQTIAGKIVVSSPKVAGKLTPSASKVGKVKRVRHSLEEVKQEQESTKAKIFSILAKKTEPIGSRELLTELFDGEISKKTVKFRPSLNRALIELRNSGEVQTFGKKAAMKFSAAHLSKTTTRRKSVPKSDGKSSIYTF